MKLRAFVLCALVCLNAWSAPLAKSERLITILATNDIHGGVEPTLKKGKKSGGLALWAGVAQSIRAGLKHQHGTQAGVVTVDAGDQFQGTLISNKNEGKLVFGAMEEVGYDAVIPGNHDYDFGPVGWLEDQSADPSKRREAFELIARQVTFPLISANTFFTNSLVDAKGKPVAVENQFCKPKSPAAINWAKAKSPDFLKSHVLVRTAGVRIALIGIDHPKTPESTTADNVADLCFGDEAEHYLRVREALEGSADVFVLIVHNGDTDKERGLTRLVEKILQAPGHNLDAVVSGHTHYAYEKTIEVKTDEGTKSVPAIQSGAGGTRFGRIDLVWNADTGKLDGTKTYRKGGIYLNEDFCDKAATFCKKVGKGVAYEGVPVKLNKKIQQLIAKERKAIKALAELPMGKADKDLTRDWIGESPMSNAMADALLDVVPEAEIAFINTGGVRDSFYEGNITYEDLFKVLPFNNHAVRLSEFPIDKLMNLLERSVKTCGFYGALMQSGLKVVYSRDCGEPGRENKDGIDPNAKLLHVETNDGTVLLDVDKGITPPKNKTFKVATMDFLATGGSGYTAFITKEKPEDLNIFREVMKDRLLKKPAHWTGNIDNRWKLEPPKKP